MEELQNITEKAEQLLEQEHYTEVINLLTEEVLKTHQKGELHFIKGKAYFIPSFMDKTVLIDGLSNVNTLNPLLQLTLQLCNSLSDTTMVNGSEAYLSARQYYNYVKQADHNNVPGAKAVYDDLAQRFPSTRKSIAPAKES